MLWLGPLFIAATLRCRPLGAANPLSGKQLETSDNEELAIRRAASNPTASLR